MKSFKSFIKEEQIEEASKKQEGKFHSQLDKLVHKTFGKSKAEMKKEEVELDEVAAWQRKEGKSESGGLNRKGIESYRRENPG